MASVFFYDISIERQDTEAHIYLKLCSFFNYENTLTRIKFYKKTKQNKTLEIIYEAKNSTYLFFTQHPNSEPYDKHRKDVCHQSENYFCS